MILKIKSKYIIQPLMETKFFIEKKIVRLFSQLLVHLVVSYNKINKLFSINNC